MDLDEVKACLRGLLSSTVFSYHLNNLLNDFRSMTGFDLPLFGCSHPVEFLRTLRDTVQLFGDPHNPEVALIESKKSAHIISLVDRQKTNTLKNKYPHFTIRQKRLVVPNKNEMPVSSNENTFFKNSGHAKTSKSPSKTKSFSQSNSQESGSWSISHPSKTYFDTSVSHQPKFNKFSAVEKSDKIALQKPNNNFSENTGSKLNQGREQPTGKLPAGSPEADSCYFEDVTDNESCLSVEDLRSNNNVAVSDSCCFVNDGIKNKLKKLIKNYPGGLWCCELPDLFLEEFNFILDYREFGYTSLIQMLSELPDVFRCIRPGNEDWILFDASVAPSPEEKRMMDLQLTSDINCEIRTNIHKLLLNFVENSSDSGIELDKILELYQKMFGSSLDFQSLGFNDLKSLLDTWEGSFLNLLKINGKIVVVPKLNITVHSPIRWEEAVPPITAENDIFIEIFPKEVVGPEESLLELDLSHHVAVGNVIEVCAAEVWSPSKFYLQLNKFKSRLNRFMDDLQKFYNVHLNKYKMPDSTIRPKQICVGLYNSDPDFPDEWHRAQIIKVINEKTVLINFVDYGTVTRVKKSQLRFLHRCFQSFPIQAFLAQLAKVVPPNDENKWPMSTSKKFLELLRVPYLHAEIIDIDFKKPSMRVTLSDPFQKSAISINDKLVQEKLAWGEETLLEHLFLLEREPEKHLEDSRPHDIQEKNLKLDSLSFSSKETSKVDTPEHLSIAYEFENVLDMDKYNKKENICKTEEEEEKTRKHEFEAKKNFSDFPTCPREKLAATEEKLNKKLVPEGVAIAEKTSSSLPGEPRRLPPGLEHMTALFNFKRTQFLMQPEDLKKSINILALELLTTNPSIKQVGVNDPALALKIATEMAEAYVSFEYSSKLSHSINSLLGDTFISRLAPSSPLKAYALKEKEPDMPEVPLFPHVPSNSLLKLMEEKNPVTATKDTTLSVKLTTPDDLPQTSLTNIKKDNEYVKQKQIGGKCVHLVTIDNEFYFCAEEIVRTFTLISNREIADRVLHMKKIMTDYRILTKKSDEKVLNAIKSSDLPIVKKKSKKCKIYLIPVLKTVPFLQALGCQTKSFENDFLELLKSENEKKCAQQKELS